MQKPSIPKGFRDFSPETMVKRNFIFDTIKSVFTRFAYQPIETPTMEKLSTLMGKYGEEGDRLIFKVLQRGDKYTKAVNALSNNQEANLSEDGLRYDLTVPFARYVVQHQSEITLPFKRYQIQPVWRADRPQKGRYREFYQCDVDVVGTDSLLMEVEFLQIYQEVYKLLGIKDYKVMLNNRKVLTGISEVIGAADKLTDITVAIDKLDKIGVEGVNKELSEKGISNEAIEQIQPLIHLKGSNDEKIEALSSFLSNSEIGLKGLEELKFVLDYAKACGADENVSFEVTLARGLSYYTGAIFEVTAEGFKGSISGGGRYDDLTGVFGLKGTSGVGISFGADRTYDLMKNLDLFPKELTQTSKIFFANFGEDEEKYAFKILSQLRQDGISGEIYPGKAKMQKQMKYAHSKFIPFVALCGSNEITENTIMIKDMETGEQTSYSYEELLKLLQ